MALGRGTPQAERIYADSQAKRRTTRYLHAKAVLVEAVTELPA